MGRCHFLSELASYSASLSTLFLLFMQPQRAQYSPQRVVFAVLGTPIAAVPQVRKSWYQPWVTPRETLRDPSTGPVRTGNGGSLVDQDLPIVGKHDARALERARRRPFEVKPRDTKAAAVARTLELVFSREELRRAVEMRADRDKRVDAARDPRACARSRCRIVLSTARRPPCRTRSVNQP